MNYIKIEIIADETTQETLIALFDECHATGFEQTDKQLFAFFDVQNFGKVEVMQILQGYSYSVSTVEEKNWNEEWEKNFLPVIVDDFVAVRAHFHPPVADVQYELVITPKMSFGTGHHATTYLMIQQMRDVNFNGKTVFDFGTGTGILSILAEKLGAVTVTAIDVDDWSIENANENLQRNGCEKVSVSLSSNIPDQKFDLVLANINKNVITKYMPLLQAALNPGSCILFSGLLTADEEDIVTIAEKHGLELENIKERSGWISMLFARKK